jgi:glycosyltransferase involved in cell wall biosynthesis
MPVKRVLHVIPSVGPVRGGPSVMVRTLARGLAQRGIQAHVATTDDNGPGRLDVPCGTPVIENGVTYWHFRRQSRFYTFSWPLTNWLATNIRNYDVVHIHALFSYAASPAAYLAHRHGVPYIVRPLGVLNNWGMRQRRPTLKKLSFNIVERRIVRNAALIHFTSEQERAEAMELGVEMQSIVIPNPLPDSPAYCAPGKFRERYPQLKDRKILLFLSRFDRKKGLDLLLNAFSQVRSSEPKTTLVLAGSGDPELTAELRAQSERLGIANDVLWPGFLQGRDKWIAMADADLFVLPSYSENFGIAVVEAMAARLPVVISDQVAIHREVSEAQAGSVVACDPGQLSQAILTMLGSPLMLKDIGRRGQRLTLLQYSSDNVARQLISVYNDILTSTQPLCRVATPGRL